VIRVAATCNEARERRRARDRKESPRKRREFSEGSVAEEFSEGLVAEAISPLRPNPVEDLDGPRSGEAGLEDHPVAPPDLHRNAAGAHLSDCLLRLSEIAGEDLSTPLVVGDGRGSTHGEEKTS
jgi:hypothetical protein